MVRRTKRPSALSLTVALHGTPSTAAPCSAPSRRTARTSPAVTSGRAASWMQTSRASAGMVCRPLKTESCESLMSGRAVSGDVERAIHLTLFARACEAQAAFSSL